MKEIRHEPGGKLRDPQRHAHAPAVEGHSRTGRAEWAVRRPSLCSDAAAQITGTTISVDGGLDGPVTRVVRSFVRMIEKRGLRPPRPAGAPPEVFCQDEVCRGVVKDGRGRNASISACRAAARMAPLPGACSTGCWKATKIEIAGISGTLRGRAERGGAQGGSGARWPRGGAGKTSHGSGNRWARITDPRMTPWLEGGRAPRP